MTFRCPQYCFMLCCSKRICEGCDLASKQADKKAGREVICAFCRARIPSENKEFLAMIQKRVEAGDVHAIRTLGQLYLSGKKDIPRNFAKGIELLKEAAKLGDVKAHQRLAFAYHEGDFGLKKDMNMAVNHYEVAAMAGHFGARHNLGIIKYNEGRFDRALRHWLVSAMIGCEKSLKFILKLHQEGQASRDDCAQALHGYQKATDEMRSSKRDEARTLSF